MEKWLKQNWFKVGILVLATASLILLAVYLFYPGFRPESQIPQVTLQPSSESSQIKIEQCKVQSRQKAHAQAIQNGLDYLKQAKNGYSSVLEMCQKTSNDPSLCLSTHERMVLMIPERDEKILYDQYYNECLSN